MAKARANGYVIDRGLSPVDGKPYVAILVLRSRNAKTGDMAQVFIMREDIHPLMAITDGSDETVCGSCPHRRKWNQALQRYIRTCYVDIGKSVSTVWKAYKRGSYPEWQPKYSSLLRGRRIRWGAYGDPAVIREAIVRNFNSVADGHTGYTHQWRELWAQWAKGLFQASCDSFDDYMEASSAGWRTFAVIPKGSDAFGGKLCPAAAEKSQAQCLTCRLCDGAKQDVFIEAHGAGAACVGQ